jgi:hypothetical protein
MADGLEEFARALNDYQRSKKVPVQKAMKTQMRLLIKRILDFTPPNTYAEGRARVASDVRSATGLLDANLTDGKDEAGNKKLYWKNPKIRQLIKDRKDSVLTRIFSKFKQGAFKGAVVGGPFESSRHRSARGRRGRVSKTLAKKATTDTKTGNAYIRKVQARVGMAQGGWAAAYDHFGGSPKSWTTRDGKHRQGTYNDESKDPINPYILLRNNSPWTKGVKAENVVKSAIRARTRDIRKSIILGHEFAIRNRLKKLNNATA